MLDSFTVINRLSNIGVPGLWMYNVGKVGENGEVGSPDLSTGDS